MNATATLNDLRARAESGEPITAAELAAAHAAVELEQLVSAGDSRRAAAAEAQAAVERREALKPVLIEKISSTTGAIEDARQALKDALVALVDAVEDQADTVHEVAGMLNDAGFRSRLNLSSHPTDGVDPRWHVVYDVGDVGRASSICVDGASYAALDAGGVAVDTLKDAVRSVSDKYSYLAGLPVRYSASLYNRLAG